MSKIGLKTKNINIYEDKYDIRDIYWFPKTRFFWKPLISGDKGLNTEFSLMSKLRENFVKL